MNYSIDKITTPTGKEKHELRVWGLPCGQIKRRLDSRKLALAELDLIILKEKTPKGEFSTTFGAEYRHWRAEMSLEFTPGHKITLDSYWREMGELLESAKIDKLESKLNSIKANWGELAQKTRNNKMGFIHAVLNFAVLEERIPYNPLGKYRKPKAQAPDIKFWMRDEAESFLAFMQDRYPAAHPSRIRFTVPFAALNTLARAGELWGLWVSDLRPQHGSIRLSRQFNRVSYKFEQLKGKEARSVPLNGPLYQELSQFIEGKRPNDLIFCKGRKAINHDVFRSLFDEDVAAWGGRPITFHGLRHTGATLSLKSGVKVEDLQNIMGHKNISTTMKYVHTLGDTAKLAGETFSVEPRHSRKVISLAEYG